MVSSQPITRVPNLNAADGQTSPGETIMPPNNPNQPVTYVPNPSAADGQDGTTGGSSGTNVSGSGGWTHGAGTPIALSISPTLYGTYTNDTDDSFWTVASGSWIQLV